MGPEPVKAVVFIIPLPNDPLPPSQTSGIRIGTPAVTTRGLGEADMVILGNVIADILHDDITVQTINALDALKARMKPIRNFCL